MHSLKKLVYCMISITAISYQLKAVCHEPLAVMLKYLYFDLSISEDRERSVHYSSTIKTQCNRKPSVSGKAQIVAKVNFLHCPQ